MIDFERLSRYRESLEPVRQATEFKVSELYLPEANRIINALGEGSMCIVTGPHKYGKSTSLIPQLHAQLSRHGYNSRTINAERYAGFPVQDYPIPQNERGVVILDEAGIPTVEEAAGIAANAYEKGNSIIPFIAYDIDLSKGRDSKVVDWQRIEQPTEVPVIHLSHIDMGEELAREFLEARVPIIDSAERDVAIEYILSFVPRYAGILADFRFAFSLEEAKKTITSGTKAKWRGAIPKELNQAIQKKAEDDLWNNSST